MSMDTTLNWLTEQLSKRLTEAIAAMAGKTPRVTAGAASGNSSGGELWWWQQSFSGIAESMVWVGASEAVRSGIGAEALKGAGIDNASADDCRGTYLELLQQALSGLAGGLTARMGREVLPQNGKLAAPTSEDRSIELRLQFEDGAEVGPVLLVWSSGFSDALKPPVQKQGGLAPESTAQPPPAEATDRYELLLDVEMPVSVSFGRAHLPLREVVKLTSGAIVELNRAVSEPVELIVNNCVVARGEVVVVDGNYGVRVKQIISRKERLRTLH